MDASDEVKEKIKKACKERKVIAADPEAMVNMLNGLNTGEVDWTVTKAYLSNCWGPWKNLTGGNDGGFEIGWGTVSAGFGSLTFYKKDGKLYCDSETLGMDFVRKVMDFLMNQVVIEKE